ncbi:DEAD-box RNA helicase, putative, partial [Rhizoctonia solani AG-3 Rhs1AP]
MSTAVAKLLLDPVRILVNRDEGILMRAPHFFVKISEDQKPAVLQASFASLSVEKLFILCRDINRIAGNSWSGGFYYMKESMGAYDCQEVLRKFKDHYRNKTALVTTSGVLPNATILNENIPLINYDVPNNVEDYIKRINDWRDANLNYHNMIVTFVAADTNEMQILHDFERYYDVRIVSLTLIDEK